MDKSNAQRSDGAELHETMATYHHTQRAPICWLLYAMSILFGALAFVLNEVPPIAYIFPIVSGLMLVIATSFHHLTVEDQVDCLSVRFGPLPLFQRRVRYDDITAVEVSQTTFIEGWGIHWSPRGGWVWNIWGRGCVLLRLKNRVFIIGTDDTENLAQYLQQRIGQDVTG